VGCCLATTISKFESPSEFQFPVFNFNQFGDAAMNPLARALLYKFLSRLFDYPRETLPPEIAADILLAAESCGVLKPFRVLLNRLRRLTADTLEQEYIRILGHVTRAEAPAYETSYGSPHAFQQTAELGDIAAFYRAHGLRPDGDERLDHISPELEFMAFLALKEANDPARAAEAREAQVQFLNDHLGRWAPAFAKRLTGRTYALAGRALEAFLQSEFEELGARPIAERSIDLSPVRFGPEGACFSCADQAQIKPEELL
jgi:TorA maturation chaperone TorD